jgi:NAD(P)-dependent dehydrogenase (short-subunit alcohol dehydrogenase family)
MKLKDKIAIITGGAAGIGKEIALGYVREGAKVVVVDIAAENLEKMQKELKPGNHGIALKVDITKRTEVDQMVETVVKEFGKIDILVNCAAIYPNVPFMEITEEDWLQVIDIDLNGVYRCTQAAAAVMLKQGSGRIINISSGQALTGVPLMAHYTAAKGGLISLTRALAAELSPLGINVNCVAPGLTATEHVKSSLPPQFLDAIGKATTIGRLARPEEYVGICVLLASDDGSYITGETIAVDGGQTNVQPPMASGFSDD